MDHLIELLITPILNGGPQVVAVAALLILILLIDRKRLTSEVAKKDERLAKIVDEYYKGNITLAEALNSLKMVLYDIRTRI